jgi:RNA polymerase sigma factor (sigma-70 family)
LIGSRASRLEHLAHELEAAIGDLEPRMKDLSDQERTVIINRFGLEGRETLTLKEVGERLGITAERVRQIERQARERLRKLISRNLAIASTSKYLPGGPPCPA